MASLAEFTPKTSTSKPAQVRALAKIASSLNVTIKSTRDLSRLARAGLPTASFETFSKQEFGFSRKEMEWIIPARTFSHRKTDGRLTLDESDKLIRAARIQALATEVLGSEEKASRWLHQERSIFDELSAMELMKTEQGAQQVEDALIQLDEGYF